MTAPGHSTSSLGQTYVLAGPRADSRTNCSSLATRRLDERPPTGMSVARMASHDRWPYNACMRPSSLASTGTLSAIDSDRELSVVSADEESGGPLVLDGPFIETKELAFARLRRGSHKGIQRRDDT